jgi:zinc transport system substrate-binding protein
VANQTDYVEPPDGVLKVIATAYPLADFAKNVGGDFIFVTNATPPGVEPHDFEPTPKEVAFMETADVFIMNGAGLDTWADDIAKTIADHGGIVVNMEKQIHFLPEDPHAWLDLGMAQDMVRDIRYAFIEKDPAHKNEYLVMTDAYLSKLNDLDSMYREGLRNCELHDIIVAHDAFGYLGRRYAFTVHPILGISPDVEPSAKDLSDLVETAKSLGVTTVFFETLLSPKLAQTIAHDINGKTDVLNPVEGLTDAQMRAKEDYVSLMTENVNALKRALVCQ